MTTPLQIKKFAKELYAWSAAKPVKEVCAAVKVVIEVFYKKGATRQLRQLVAVLERLEQKQHGVTEVRIAAAWPLGSALEEKILQAIGVGESKITTVINPDLLGGAEIRFNDKLVNFSLKHQLNNLLDCGEATP